ncbi:MAG: nicotinate (nicotinamide) nucleotide adenylyltransferase [Planctomycetota bacterium]|jgi:nicotinate-nucleotide adenylyltransferase|nr:nicotinate (nicotinamide) nucleotide adenylyltransferase [Planctomycetota bacterium]
MRSGILGGSFNPPHRAHLALARAALDTRRIDRVVFIPAALPPHKKKPAETDAPTRLAMTRILCAGDPRLAVDGLELDRSGPSFSADTARQLKADHPGDEYRLIIGSDMALSFGSWREPAVILDLAPPLVAERPGSPLPENGLPFPGLTPEQTGVLRSGRFFMAPIDLSSTMIRELLARGIDDREALRYLTPGVLRFIRKNRLYESPPAARSAQPQ